MIASKPINWTRPLILIPNTMLKWYKNYTYLFYRKQSIFILWWGAGWEWWNDSDSKCEIFIFRSSFYAIIDQHEILDKEIPNLVINKNSLFTIKLNSVPVSSKKLSFIDAQIINKDWISGQKRPNLYIFFKKKKIIIIFGACQQDP